MTGGDTAGAWVALAAKRLAAADIDIDRPLAEARAILAETLDTSPERVFAYPETNIDSAAASKAKDLLERRLAGAPLGRLLGRREFWSLSLALGPDVLEPRPDTETLVAAALDLMPPGRALRVLDLGVGSGAVLLALLSERPLAVGVGVDRAPGAVRVARSNAAALGFSGRASFLAGDWGAALGDGRFDVIVSNPPYVADGDPALEAAARQHDPPQALFGGPDGLDAYRAILADIPRLAGEAGVVAFEIGANQAAEVIDIAASAGLALLSLRQDLAGRDRCLTFAPPQSQKTIVR